MPRTLIIVRHAHRDKSQGREQDNGLSKKGKKQAEKVLDFYKARFEKAIPLLYSSSKLRCVETIEPIAEKYKTQIEASPLLMEQGGFDPKEEASELLLRVKDFFSTWRRGEGEITIACTHGDWIPVFAEHYFDSKTELKKGGWMEVSLIDKKPVLTWIVQEFP